MLETALKIIALLGMGGSALVLLFIARKKFINLPARVWKPVLVLANFLSGIAVLATLFLPIAVSHKLVYILWKIGLVSVSRQSWKAKAFHPRPFFFVALFGLLVCVFLIVDCGVTDLNPLPGLIRVGED